MSSYISQLKQLWLNLTGVLYDPQILEEQHVINFINLSNVFNSLLPKSSDSLFFFGYIALMEAQKSDTFDPSRIPRGKSLVGLNLVILLSSLLDNIFQFMDSETFRQKENERQV